MVKRFIKRVTRPIRKIAKKIIPKEVRPFLPYIAAVTPGLQGFAAAGGITNAAAQKALIAGLTAAATDEDANILRTAALAGGPDLLSSGLGKLSQAGDIPFGPQPKGSLSGILKAGQQIAQSGSEILKPTTFAGKAKLVGSQAAVDQAAKLAEINQDEIDKYNEELRKKGVLDKTKRRTSILNIYLNAGYEPDYVNSMLDRYGYESGGRIGFAEGLGIFDQDILESISIGYAGSKDAMKAMFTKNKKKKKKQPEMTVNEEGKIVVNFPDSEDDSFEEALATAERGLERISKPTVQPTPMMKFSTGGEVEIEEETDDLNILDFMKDQGIPYGQQASDINNERVLEQLYEEFLDMGLSPADAAKAARDAFDRMSRKEDNSGIMQMASGYKTDIEEMYEQYVFEMEEQGLQPMSFSDFLAQARSGMANGGSAGSRYSFLINKQKQGILSPDEEQELLMLEMTYADDSQGKADGGNVKRRKKGDPEDEIIETEKEEEIILDKMPRPKRQGIMEVADGGIMEKDMRGGGFIPEGTKERADDVPARLSKNEFVMTADAVRAAGGGSVNKGAKRMYDMMYQLEGKV